MLMHIKGGLHPGHRQDKPTLKCQMQEERHTDITSAPETGNCDGVSRQFTVPEEKCGRFNKALGFI